MKVVLFVICAATLAYAITDEQKEKIKAAHDKCQADPASHVDESEFKHGPEGHPDPKKLGPPHILYDQAVSPPEGRRQREQGGGKEGSDDRHQGRGETQRGSRRVRRRGNRRRRRPPHTSSNASSATPPTPSAPPMSLHRITIKRVCCCYRNIVV
ncbi:hypothetical protein NQ318_008540 [Aromia moschata]|uniref:Uncharacterized protein n=1 Tax=Aromia moschata TaxID=1265417 RepID=A0AAV8YWD9_9CUCU|nr:hypothetical protein NQ318_008540 [Aromia moschata]